MSSYAPLPLGDLAGLLLQATPAAYVAAAAAATLPRLSPARVWGIANAAAALGAALALLAAVAGTIMAFADPLGHRPAAAQLLLAPLIAVLGLVSVRFSVRSLSGEVGEGRFARWLLLALAGATFVVATDHLLLLALGWVITSLSMQRLLTFYQARPMARLAALEKFFVSRAADACVLTAAALLAAHAGTLHVDGLLAGIVGPQPIGEVRAAAALIAIAALLKCAQLPFHGWLLRVMEAPTPVSALLHAGVVNLGGFVVVRLWPLFEASPEARWLLVLFGGVTAAIGALAATTQPAVKLALAWSTCAQMGFMLLQCGLGLPEMALLHMVGHSAYKAHAFLSAASSVQRSAAEALAPDPARHGLGVAGLAALASFLLVGAIGLYADALSPDQPELLAAAVIVAFALVPLMVQGHRSGVGQALLGLVAAAMVAAGWLLLHELLSGLVPKGPSSPASVALAVAALAAMLPLLLVRMRLAASPGGAFAARLHRLCQRGLYLDVWWSRLVARLGRAPLHAPPPASLALLPSRNLQQGEL